MTASETPNSEARRIDLEAIAMMALDAGRLFMEAGASANNVDELVTRVARGLGAERVDLRIGYASLAITVGVGRSGITRMRRVTHIGVNQRVDHELRRLASRLDDHPMTPEVARVELDRIVRNTPRHSSWVTAVAVGLACAAFARLLQSDWLGVGPVFLGASIGQYVRRELASRQVNVFIGASLVSFLASTIAGVGAHLAGSETVVTAMIASILLLVPGVPALNAQNDILDGRPTLGSARSVWVAVLLIFITVGLWLAQALLKEGY